MAAVSFFLAVPAKLQTGVLIIHVTLPLSTVYPIAKCVIFNHKIFFQYAKECLMDENIALAVCFPLAAAE